ncbi:hypothetical protein [Methylopila turkensis]|uniref:Uncharacterized protein n=1 Tax=Methylopila turkensis TaxID=1437816 RepID=A0A9W6N7V8_9HYPH|nr:hypothetical protein [Methylopila turkensis]GLK80830.1 hypothetical protein GCM10008174_25710 [Methylopila turkensis]
MTTVDDRERDTLMQLAHRTAFEVFDGSTLCELHEKGLVAFEVTGWEVTPEGFDALGDGARDK